MITYVKLPMGVMVQVCTGVNLSHELPIELDRSMFPDPNYDYPKIHGFLPLVEYMLVAT